MAHAAIRLALTDTPVDSASDHGAHEAIYLADPDANGIELAADRRRARWPARLDAAGLPADAAEGGFVTRDPWENAVVLRNEGGTQ